MEIEINEIKGFAEAGFCVDQPGLVVDILELRKRWKLDVLVDYDRVELWFREPHIDFSLGRDAADLMAEAWDRLEIDKVHGWVGELELGEREKGLQLMSPMEFDLEVILRKYGLGSKYKGLLLRAIVCGVVREPDLDSNNKYGFSKDFISEGLVETSFWMDWFRRVYTGTEKREFKRDRDWYLKHKEGTTLKALADEYGIEREGVKAAISRYKKFLEGYK